MKSEEFQEFLSLINYPLETPLENILQSNRIVFLGEKNNNNRIFDKEVLDILDELRKQNIAVSFYNEKDEEINFRDYRSAAATFWMVLSRFADLYVVADIMHKWYEKRKNNKGNQEKQSKLRFVGYVREINAYVDFEYDSISEFYSRIENLKNQVGKNNKP